MVVCSLSFFGPDFIHWRGVPSAGAGFFLAELAARAPANSDLRNSFFCEMRRQLWARSYGVAAARGGL